MNEINPNRKNLEKEKMKEKLKIQKIGRLMKKTRRKKEK